MAYLCADLFWRKISVDTNVGEEYTGFTMSRYCRKCSLPIPDARRLALPETEVCVACSDEQPLKGHMSWEHKTAPAFQIVTPQQHAEFQRYTRKRPGASLPMGSRTASDAAAFVAPSEASVRGQAELRQTTSVQIMREVLVVNDGIPRARCGHNDRPQVNQSGKCVECAVAYYAMRAGAGANFSKMA